MTRRSLAWRVWRHLAGLTALAVLVLSVVFYLSARRLLWQALDSDLAARSTALAALVERDGTTWDVDLAGASAPSRDLVGALAWWRITPCPEQETLLESSAAPDASGPNGRAIDLTCPTRTLPLTGSPPVVLEQRWRTSDAGALRLLSTLIAVRADTDAGDSDESPVDTLAIVRITAAASAGPVQARLRTLLLLMALGAGLSLLLATIAARLLARRIVGPLERISAQAESIAVTSGPGRVDRTGTGDEIDRLAATLNESFERLHAAYERQTRFTADASHELRTPVTAIRSQVEVALRRERPAHEYRETLVGVLPQVERLSQLIESLLQLARFDTGRADTTFSRVKLAEVVQGAIDDTAGDDPRIVGTERVEPLLVCGHERWLRVAVANLLSNARRHCRTSGAIEVQVRAADGQALIEVIDAGEGIPPEALAHLFERFYQVDPARSIEPGTRSRGAGLGLSLVATIVALHGGSCGIQSQLGRGTTAWIRLPLEVAA